MTEFELQMQQAYMQDLLDQTADVEFTRPTPALHARNVGTVVLDPSAINCRIWEGGESVTLTMDDRTAAVIIYAARLVAAQFEGHAREVRALSGQFPQGSYGYKNRVGIADRQTRLAARLRVVESKYRDEVGKDWNGI